MTEHARISTIIISWSTRDLLLAYLDSLKHTVHAVQEIIVVDNASQDGSALAAHLQFPYIHLIQNTSNLGYTPANNQAIRVAGELYLLLINADASCYQKQWIVCWLLWKTTHAAV